MSVSWKHLKSHKISLSCLWFLPQIVPLTTIDSPMTNGFTYLSLALESCWVASPMRRQHYATGNRLSNSNITQALTALRVACCVASLNSLTRRASWNVVATKCSSLYHPEMRNAIKTHKNMSAPPLDRDTSNSRLHSWKSSGENGSISPRLVRFFFLLPLGIGERQNAHIALFLVRDSYGHAQEPRTCMQSKWTRPGDNSRET